MGSVYNLFGALLNGAALLPFDLKVEGVHQLGRWLVPEELSICHSVPAAFSLRGASPYRWRAFSQPSCDFHLSGTPVSSGDMELYKSRFSPECIFVHRMGTTESGTIRWYFMDKTTPIDGTKVPIGFPVEDKEVFLLDASGEDAGRDSIGEIAVKSRNLSLGYWRRPDLTRDKFLPDPNGGDERTYLTGDLGRMAADGCLFHLGRQDFPRESPRIQRLKSVRSRWRCLSMLLSRKRP